MIPIDLKRCQAEKSNGANALTLGGTPQMIRCSEKPTHIIEESKPASDGLQGSMSVCDHCLQMAKEQLPTNFFITRKIDE